MRLVKWTQPVVCLSSWYSFIWSSFQVSVPLDRFPWSPCQPTGLIDTPPLAHVAQRPEAGVIHCKREQCYSSSESFHSSHTGMAKPFTLALLHSRVADMYVKSYRPFQPSEVNVHVRFFMHIFYPHIFCQSQVSSMIWCLPTKEGKG